MRCLSDEQIELLATILDDPSCLPLMEHVQQCDACRCRLGQMQGDATLIRDIRELRESRQRAQTLTEELTRRDGGIAPG